MKSGKITLSAQQQSRFEIAIKRGVLKELHRARLLTDTQLNLLLTDIQHQNAGTLNNKTSGLES